MAKAKKAVARTPVKPAPPPVRRAPTPPVKAVDPVQPGKQLATGSWRERAALSVAAGKKASALIPAQTGSFLSFRNGVITLGGVKMENPLPLVILAYGFERSYYSGPYQPDVQATPDCYSYDGVAPHPQAKVPQNDRCSACRFNEFGSAENGKGKACKEGARFVAIHADSLESVAKIATATIVQAKLSVLNSKGFRSYCGVFEEAGVPIWQGITQLTVVPDSKSQYATSFQNETAEGLGDEHMDAIALRVDEAEKMMVQPYPELEVKAPPTRTAARRKF